MKEFERVRWRCRRGMLELDIILQRFMDKHYRHLSSEEKLQFDKLLTLADNDLWDLICTREGFVDADQRTVLKLLQES